MFFNVLINLSVTTDCTLLCVEYIYILFFCGRDCIDVLSGHILFGLRLDSFKISWKALVIVAPFLSFKGITHVYLLKISIALNKKRTLLLNLLISCLSARSALQMLSTKDECTIRFSNILMIGLCNSSANYLLDIISF